MHHRFERYRPRALKFQEILKTGDWKIKVYTISNRPAFESQDILQNAVQAVPDWLSKYKYHDLPVYDLGWLTVHEGREGVWVLLSWWTGGEMLETVLHFVDYKQPNQFQSSPYSKNDIICVWELEVVIHERQAWIDHVLNSPDTPDFAGYLNNVAGGGR